MEQKLIGLICPKCLSKWVRTNTIKGTHVCRRCGFVWDVDLEVKVSLE